MSAALKIDCDDAHDDYYERRSVPRIRLLLISTLAGALSTVAIGLFFVVTAKITEHELKDTQLMVSRREFDSTISRIERKIDNMDSNLAESLQNVSDKLSENHQAILRSQARR